MTIDREQKLEKAIEKAEYNLYSEEVLSCLMDFELFDRKKWFAEEIISPYKGGEHELQALKEAISFRNDIKGEYQLYKWDVFKLIEQYDISFLEWYVLLKINFLPSSAMFSVDEGDQLLFLWSPSFPHRLETYLVSKATGSIDPIVIYRSEIELVLEILSKK